MSPFFIFFYLIGVKDVTVYLKLAGVPVMDVIGTSLYLIVTGVLSPEDTIQPISIVLSQTLSETYFRASILGFTVCFG